MKSASSGRRLQAFTMIEIAIAIAVIGFALVAIVGILPLGLNVQKDNREDTIVNADGRYFMDVIRFGRQGVTQDQGKALDFLTNYVESITITKSPPPANAPTPMTFAVAQGTLTNGQEIMDLLCTPRYEPAGTNFIFTNTVVATIRGMSGSAQEQYGANNQVAFKYQMEVQLVPYSITPLMIGIYTNYLVGITNNTTETNQVAAENSYHYLQNNLHELRLAFTWPVLPSGNGASKRYLRSTISGRLRRAPWGIDPTDTYNLFFVDPQTFWNDPNIGNYVKYPVYPN
jgi:type II secretory pathway pseudopilin PulG